MNAYSAGPLGLQAKQRYDREMATPSGQVRPLHSSELAIALIYIYPVGRPEYDDAARRFVSSYREFPPLADHTLHVVFNGEAPSECNRVVFDGIPCQFHRYDNTGWDIGAFQRAAREIDCDLIVCLGANTYFRRSGWLRRMADVFIECGDGLYGGSASYQVDPHIRTADFWCHPELIRAYPKGVLSFDDRYEFEHGDRSITRMAEHLGVGCWMVTWDGVYPEAEWRTPADIYWRGDQSNSLVYDRLFDVYDSNPLSRPLFTASANGWGHSPDARGLGKTEGEWLAEVDPDSGGDEAAGEMEYQWAFLAREVLRAHKQSAPDEVAIARIEDEFVDELRSADLGWVRPAITGQIQLHPDELRSPGMTRSALRFVLGLIGISEAPPNETEPDNVWVMREGMRLSLFRRVLLRLLQPFVDRQHEPNARNAVMLALLTDELDWLHGRIEELDESGT